jgi:hypothetical protein
MARICTFPRCTKTARANSSNCNTHYTAGRSVVQTKRAPVVDDTAARRALAQAESSLTVKRTPRVRNTKKARIADIVARCSELRSLTEELGEELQEWFDNMPEGIQGGSKGEAVESIIDTLSELTDALESAESMEPEW